MELTQCVKNPVELRSNNTAGGHIIHESSLKHLHRLLFRIIVTRLGGENEISSLGKILVNIFKISITWIPSNLFGKKIESTFFLAFAFIDYEKASDRHWILPHWNLNFDHNYKPIPTNEQRGYGRGFNINFVLCLTKTTMNGKLPVNNGITSWERVI